MTSLATDPLTMSKLDSHTESPLSTELGSEQVGRNSLEDAHLELQSVEHLKDTMHVTQQLVCGCDLLAVLVRVVLVQEGQAVHLAGAQPVSVIPVSLALPLSCSHGTANTHTHNYN